MPSSNGIALNVTRTRVTVLVFNLTVISVMMSILSADRVSGGHAIAVHLTSFVALFIGFCLTILGVFWLLRSQDWDALGLSRPREFTLGAITTYLALSQTVTAFMHEYLVAFETAVGTPQVGVAGGVVLPNALGDTALLFLLIMGGGIWVLTSYVAPLAAGIKGARLVGGRGLFLGYYLVLQVPVYWVNAKAWQLEYAPLDQTTDVLGLFAMQFVQPLLWFRW